MCLKITNILVILVLFLAVIGCALVYNPATQRKEIVIINTGQEVQFGRNFDQQIRKEHTISSDAELKKRLETIGSKVAQFSDRQDLSYHFEIIEEKELNAFAIPGGFIYVHSATINEASDDELASILSHEIGHIAARHPVKKLEAQYGYQIGYIILSLTGGKVDPKIANAVINQIMLGYSREDERFADKIGIKYTYKAGFNPDGMISFFNKLLELEKNKLQVPIFMRSHPYVEERIQNAKDEIQRVKTPNISASETPQPQEKSEITPQPQITSQEHEYNGFCKLCQKTYPEGTKFCTYHGLRIR